MPIYAYKCGSCGHTKDVLQKISDQPQTLCPVCAKETWSKQLSAPGFQLKGTGWYATDFKNGGNAPATAVPQVNEDGKAAKAGEGGSAVAPEGGASTATPVTAGSSGSPGAQQPAQTSSSSAGPSQTTPSAGQTSGGGSAAPASSPASCSPGCACH